VEDPLKNCCPKNIIIIIKKNGGLSYLMRINIIIIMRPLRPHPAPGISAYRNLSRTLQNRVEQPRSIPAPGRGHTRVVFVLKK
jgi:hypothetical protein